MKHDGPNHAVTNGWDLEELVLLGPDHPARAEAVRRIESLQAAERESMLAAMAEADRLREVLGRVEVPATLESKLLKIAAGAEPRQAGRRTIREVLATPLSWRAVAACLLVGLAVLAIVMWPVTPAHERPLDASIAQRLKAIALKHHNGIEGTRLDFASDDEAKVKEAMLRRGLPFEPTLLRRSRSVALLGEGGVDFEGAPGVFTRWQSTGGEADATGLVPNPDLVPTQPPAAAAPARRFTLFQFDGRPLGVPEVFAPTVLSAETGTSQRVEIWAGADGACTWVLVADGESEANPFLIYGY